MQILPLLLIYDAGTIQGWVNKYLAAVAAVSHWAKRPLISGMKSWREWEEREDFYRFEFVIDESRKKAIQLIREQIAELQSVTRLIGLSGLGKTRLVYEALKPKDETDFLCDKAVYIDASYGAQDIAARVSEWIRCNYEGVIIVDNCDLELHKNLMKEVKSKRSRFSLLTIDYNLEEDQETLHTVKLDTLDNFYIKQMLEPVYGKRIMDLDRIVSFAEGFPQIAVLLADARLNEIPEMSSLTDDELLKKIVWGKGQQIDTAYRVIKGCSLFEQFGLFYEASEEYEFIAKELIDINTDDFYKYIKLFNTRGILDIRGRYGKVIPTPLAIRLASDWYSETHPDRLAEIIQKPMPGHLDNSFFSRFSKLDFLSEIKDLVKNLCNDQGPFGTKESILSVRGARLFNSFVEVNPKATIDALKRVFEGITKPEILTIDLDIMSYLIWSLEKLCFRNETFYDAAYLMLRLAACVSKIWSDNAKSRFLQLF